ncbi:MAG TPA: amidohydrolase [Verrucomicrobiae bacterium]|nr:amidohydrolase [Verrucomicrobiae bacterium]
MKSLYGAIAVCLAALVCGCPGLRAQGADGTDRVLFNAKVFTGVPDHPYAEAVAIRRDKIVAVGNLAEVMQSVGSGVEKIDLRGRTLFPGFIDSHAHPIDGGISLISADVSDLNLKSVDALVRFALEAKNSGRGMRGDVLSISSLPLAFWSKTAELNSRFNSGDFAGVPVFLTGMDGHTGWANQIVLKRAGVTADFLAHLSAGERAYYGTDQDGEPNGFAVDAGLDKVQAVVPAPSREQLVIGGRAAVRYLNSLGITGWLDALATDSVLATYKSLADGGELTAHVAAFWKVNPRNDPTKELKIVQRARQEYAGTPNLTVPGIKVFGDGVAEYPSQTAALSKPYKNSGRSGDLLFDPARFAQLAILADKQGLIVHVHAIGDRAVKEALNGIEEARKANGDSGLPDTLTHVQLADPDDFPRFKQLGVVAALQLFWATAEPDSVELLKPYIDPELYRWQYPARSLLDAGATISGASDWPVSTPNVFYAIYQAETRKGPEGVLDPEQRMPREAMLFAYTRNSARALNQQDRIGSIAPGMQADLVLLDRDVLTVSPDELRDTKVLWTMFGGKTVYRAR